MRVVIDRPMECRDPKLGIKFPVNYGFAPGAELDAYVLGVDEPIAEIEGLCIAVIRRKGEDESRLVVVPSSHHRLSDDEIRDLTAFHSPQLESEIVRDPEQLF